MLIPDAYPFVERDPRARCRLWMHPKAVVRAFAKDSTIYERYDCQCGKFYWLSQADGRRPLVRFRVREAA